MIQTFRGYVKIIIKDVMMELDMIRPYNEEVVMPTFRVVSHLKEVIEKRGVSISDVIYGTRLSDPAVRRWYHNKIERVHVESAARLCKFLNCSMDELYSIVEE